MQSSKKIGFLIKLFIILLTFWFLYRKVFVDQTFNNLWYWFIDILKSKSPFPLFAVLLLMILNWLVESVKWKYLISKLETVSIWLSIKAIFLGVTVSVFTPNRVGEFGGRIFCLKKADHIKAVLCTMLGNLSQLLATVLFGSLALCYYLFVYDDLFGLDYSTFRWLLITLNVLLLLSTIYVLKSYVAFVVQIRNRQSIFCRFLCIYEE